jgi:dienelactone hydrolase
MIRVFLFALVMTLLGSAVLAQPKPDDPLADQAAAGRALLDALAKGDFAAAGKDFDDTMKKVMPADKLESTWKAIQEKLGAFKKRTAVRTEKGKTYDNVFLTCEFEKATVDLKVVFTADKKVTGFFLVQPKGAYEFKPPPYAKPDSYREVEVTAGAADWPLPATLTLPKGDGPFAAVVLVHGSGPHDRDETVAANKPFRDLAWGLASQGVAVLRYEKRTLEHGARYVQLKDPGFKEELIDDATASAALLRKHKEIDPKRVFVLGHSLGASWAPRIGILDADLAGLVVMAGYTRPLEDLILEQLTYLSSLGEGLKDEELAKLKEQVARVKDPKLAADTPRADLPLGIPAASWLELRKYDPAATAAGLKMPMLVLQGERDYQVTMADFEGWKKALAGRKGATLKSYPKLNHLFMEGEGKSRPQEYQKGGHIAAEVVDDIAAWVKKQ